MKRKICKSEDQASSVKMNCVEFRRAIGADPQHPSEAAVAHRAGCAECAAYERNMLEVDGLLRRALTIPVPATATAPVALPAHPAPKRWYAMAASTLLAVMVG